MTMLSFRVDDEEADLLRRWSSELGLDRSELLRQALHKHLVRLASERDVDTWHAQPMTDDESSFADIADWGPAEDWSDWGMDAKG